MKRLIVGLLVLAGVLVAVDFGAAGLSESAVSREMRTRIGLDHDPDVRINGFPFLAGMAAGDYAGIDVTADRLQRGEMREVEIVAQLTGVTTPEGLRGPLEVDRLDSTVRVGANDLERLVGGTGEDTDVERLRIETVDEELLEKTVEQENGDPSLTALDAETTARLVGTVQDVPGEDAEESEIAVIVTMELGADGQVTLVPRDVRLYGDEDPFPADVAATYTELFGVTVSPGPLPLDIRPRTVRAQGGEIEISGFSRNLVIGAEPAVTPAQG